MYRDLQRTCRAIVLLIESLLNDVHFAVAVYIVKEEAARRGDDRGWVGVVLVFFFLWVGVVIKQTTFLLLILLNVLVSFPEIRIY